MKDRLPGVKINILDQTQQFDYFLNSCVYVGKFLSFVPKNTPIRVYNKEQFISMFGDVESRISMDMLENGYKPLNCDVILGELDKQYLNEKDICKDIDDLSDECKKRKECLRRKKEHEYIKNYYKHENILDSNFTNPWSKEMTPEEVRSILQDYLAVLNYIEYGTPMGLIVIRYESEEDLQEIFDEAILTGEDFWTEIIIASHNTLRHSLISSQKNEIPVIVGMDVDTDINLANRTNDYPSNVYCVCGERRVKFKGKTIRTPIAADVAGLRSTINNVLGVNNSHCNVEFTLGGNLVVPKISNQTKLRLYNNNINYLEYFNGSVVISGEKTNGGDLTMFLIKKRVRRTLEGLASKFLFEINSEKTRWGLQYTLKNALERYLLDRVITDYKTICDYSNNKDNGNTINCTVLIKIPYKVEYIDINIVATNNI